MTKRQERLAVGDLRRARTADRFREDAHRRRADQVRCLVDRVTGLADDAATSRLVVLHPMIGRDRAGIEAKRDGQRGADSREGPLDVAGGGREAAVEPDHHQRGGVTRRA